MDSEELRKLEKLIGLGLIMLAPFFFYELIIWLPTATGIIFSTVGLGAFATGKGRQAGWGILGLFGPLGAFLGLVFLALFPERNPAQPGSKTGTTGETILVVILLVALLSVIAIPQFERYIGRARSAEARDHVRMIHSALVKWQGDPDSGDGHLPGNVEAPGKDGKTFIEIFPKEAEWLHSGRRYHVYAIKEKVIAEGNVVPVVMARTTGGARVCADRVQSDPDGKAIVTQVSDWSVGWLPELIGMTGSRC